MRSAMYRAAPIGTIVSSVPCTSKVGTVGVGGGEEDAHRGALRHADDRRTLGPSRVHYGPHVIHSSFERRCAAHSVGHAGPALVEDDEARMRCPTASASHHTGHPPAELDMRHRPRHELKVKRPLACDLIGDRDVAASRISRLGEIHDGSLGPQETHASLPIRSPASTLRLDVLPSGRGVSDRLCRHDRNEGASCLRRSTRLNP